MRYDHYAFHYNDCLMTCHNSLYNQYRWHVYGQGNVRLCDDCHVTGVLEVNNLFIEL